MEPCNTSFRKILYFRRKFSKLKKFKKIYSEKISHTSQKKVFLTFWEMKLSTSKIKKALIFSHKKLFLHFRKWNFSKTLLIT